MGWYAKHGHVPSDDEIARHGCRAFGPAREPFVPAKADFERAHQDLATGDPEELAELAEELAELFPPALYPCFPWGYGTWDDDF